MNIVTPNKDLRQILKNMSQAGYLVEKGSRHIKITNPVTRGVVFIGSTPRGGSRTRLNMLRELKRIGWPDNPPEVNE